MLIPEIPYDVEKIAEAIRARRRQGKHFNIVAVAEGALSEKDAAVFATARRGMDRAEGQYGVMVAAQAGAVTPVPLREVAGQRKTVPLDRPCVRAAQAMGVNFGGGLSC